MKHEIIGGSFPVLVCNLNTNESMITQRGGMNWRSADITMETNTVGGLLKGLKRSLTGSSFFLNNYTANKDNQEIAFGLNFPGEILTFDLSQYKEIITQKTAFIAGTSDVNIDIFFNRKLGAGIFLNEGFILEHFSGSGLVFVEINGMAVERTLAPGEKLLIDCGVLAAMETTVTFDIEMVKGLKNIAFGGEGLFLGKLTGPGKVWLQTLPISGMERMLGSGS